MKEVIPSKRYSSRGALVICKIETEPASYRDVGLPEAKGSNTEGKAGRLTYIGTSCQACHEQAIARRMATIALSLRDKSYSPMGSLIKLALMGFQPPVTL